MKGNLFYIVPLLLSVFLLTNCKKEDVAAEASAEVNQYINQLKSNRYSSSFLPAFGPRHIPALLKHRNESQAITTFPVNPFSSFAGHGYKLGIVVLWTIESIRLAGSKGVKHPFDRFPSQNPVLAKRNADQLEMVFDDNSFRTASKAYKDWWNSSSDFSLLKNIDPLKDTDYRWH